MRCSLSKLNYSRGQTLEDCCLVHALLVKFLDTSNLPMQEAEHLILISYRMAVTWFGAALHISLTNQKNLGGQIHPLSEGDAHKFMQQELGWQATAQATVGTKQHTGPKDKTITMIHSIKAKLTALVSLTNHQDDINEMQTHSNLINVTNLLTQINFEEFLLSPADSKHGLPWRLS